MTFFARNPDAHLHYAKCRRAGMRPSHTEEYQDGNKLKMVWEKPKTIVFYRLEPGKRKWRKLREFRSVFRGTDQPGNVSLWNETGNWDFKSWAQMQIGHYECLTEFWSN